MSSQNRDNLKKTEYIVVRENVSNSVQKTVVPKHFQIGLDDPEFKSHLAVYGGAVIRSGLTGSLQKLPDGSDYLRGANDITITNNVDGSVTIGAPAAGFSGNTTNNLTAGDGVALNSGTTFNGSAARTISVDLATNSGLGISSNKLKVDINALTEATPAAGDFLIMRDATDNALKKFNFSSISTNAQASVTLNNALTAGQGLAYTTSGDTYNNSAAKTMKVDFASNAGLAFNTGNELIISPTAATSESSVADDDVVLIGDTSDSGNLKKVTIANLRPSTLSNALTSGNGLEFESGTNYNNAAARQLRVKTNGSTIASSNSGISVASTPGVLSHTTGIAALSFNGSSSTTIGIDTSVVPQLAASTNTFTGNMTVGGNLQTKVLHGGDGNDLIKAGSNVSISKDGSHGTLTISTSNTLDVDAMSTGTPARADLMLIEQSGTNKKTTAAAIADLVDRTTLIFGSDTIASSAPNAATAATLSVKVANNTIGTTTSGIHVQRVPNTVVDGTGILDFSYDGSTAKTVAIDNSIVATLTGSVFSGDVKFNTGISGSLQALTNGLPYIVGGTGVMVTTSSIGQVIITNDFDPNITVAASDIIMGSGPANFETRTGDIKITTPDTVTIDATTTIFNGSVKAINGLTGSLQKLNDGSPYLRSGNNVSITTGSNGSVTISVDNVRDKDVYTLDATNALTNIPLTGSDASTVGYDPHLIDVFLNGILMYSGSSTAVQNAQADYYLTGPSSLQFSFAVEANDLLGVVVNTASGGGGGGAAADAPYITFEAHGILENERVLRASEFMSLTTGSAGFIDFDIKRKKLMIPVTSALSAGSPLNSGFNFSKANYDPQRIDVFVNGVLMATGSNQDYVLQPTNNVVFSFDLFVDDNVTINIT